MKTPDYRLKSMSIVPTSSRGEKELPQGSIIKVVDKQYLPQDCKLRDHPWFNEWTAAFSYYGLVLIKPELIEPLH